MMMRNSIIVLSTLLSITQAIANVSLPRFFSSHMVLQQNEPIVIFGTADKGEKVYVTFHEMSQQTVTNADGKWSVTFQPIKAGGPYTMSVKGNNHITLSDVYVGEVWFCSGQSNMGWKLENALNGDEELANANYDKIKLFTPKRYMSGQPETELISGTWETCTSENAEGFSAVAYFFGRHLYQKYNVPIGLINSSWGGTNIEAWMSESLLNNHPESQKIISKMKAMDMLQAARQFKIDDYAYRDKIEVVDIGGKEHWEKETTDYTDWQTIKLPNRWALAGIEKTYGVIWVTKSITLTEADIQDDITLSIGRVDDKDVTYFNGEKIGESAKKDLERKYTIPKNILRAGENRITIKVANFRDYGGFRSADDEVYITTAKQKMSLVGNWKYKKGTPTVEEPPARVHPRYYPTSLYNSMVNPFFGYNVRGVIWYQGESNVKNPEEYAQFFPKMIEDWREKWGKEFPFLFVQVANYAEQENREAPLREAQALALKLNKTAMVVTLDIGEDYNVHPANKQDVGKRLGMAAQHIAYGEKEVSKGGPSLKEASFKNDSVTLSFDQELVVKGDMNAINGFMISSNDKTYYPAKVEVYNNTIKLYNKDVKKPKYVTYLWADAPGNVMIYNNQELPAPPFKIEK